MPQKLEVSKPNEWFRMDGREEAGAEGSEHGLGLVLWGSGCAQHPRDNLEKDTWNAVSHPAG